VYYEVVGFIDSGAPIMAECANKKLNDKEFVKQYGETTTFSYGCVPFHKEYVTEDSHAETGPQSDLYVYRMTMTNEDGDTVEYTPDFMRYRCEQMGAKTVPVFWKGDIPEYPATADDDTISPGDWIKNVAEKFYDGPDPIGKTHIREGVVVRIINRPKFAAYKHKNFAFKVLEGIIKETAEAPDMEEAEALIEEENE
jgi:cellulose synthase/poly-beta-1,6-N-acetylglucosamine synthase-like glycosyltransferase